MAFLAPLAGLLGIQVEALTERLKQAILLNALMAIFGVIAAVFLLVTAYVALAAELGAVYAGLIMAGVFILLALVMLAILKSAEARHRRLVLERKRSSDTSAFVTTAALTALPALLRSPTVRTIGIPAAVAAAVLLLRRKDD